MPDRLTIAARTQGRVLVRRPSSTPPWPALIGFHGYGMNAGQMIELLEQIPGAGAWLLVSVQGLHRFYARDQKTVVASWMTSEDREAAIADNIRYVADVVDAVRHAWPFNQLVYAGFSQGVAMAFRASVRAGRACDGVLALGGDIPPELLTDPSIDWPRVVLGRGDDDLHVHVRGFCPRCLAARTRRRARSARNVSRRPRVESCVLRGGGGVPGGPEGPPYT